MFHQKISLVWIFPLTVGFLLSLLGNVYFFTHARAASPTKHQVMGVIDGDTFVIEGKKKIRLRHIQAPELGLCGADAAKVELERLISGKYVTFSDEIPDKYGRDMAIVFVGDVMVNKALIAGGFVRYYRDITPYTNELKVAGDTAEKASLGLFKSCQSTVNPHDPSCIIKGNIHQPEKSHIYFLPSCAQYNYTTVSEDLGEQWFCTEKEAQSAGYTRANTCK